MNDESAIKALAALAQEHRLAIFKNLMRAGPPGLSAGAIADRLALAPSKASFHLSHLERAGLLRSWRVHRNIFYAVEIDVVRLLMRYLTEECCGGHPEICGDLVELVSVCDAKREEVS